MNKEDISIVFVDPGDLSNTLKVPSESLSQLEKSLPELAYQMIFARNNPDFGDYDTYCQNLEALYNNLNGLQQNAVFISVGDDYIPTPFCERFLPFQKTPVTRLQAHSFSLTADIYIQELSPDGTVVSDNRITLEQLRELLGETIFMAGESAPWGPSALGCVTTAYSMIAQLDLPIIGIKDCIYPSIPFEDLAPNHPKVRACIHTMQSALYDNAAPMDLLLALQE